MPGNAAAETIVMPGGRDGTAYTYVDGVGEVVEQVLEERSK